MGCLLVSVLCSDCERWGLGPCLVVCALVSKGKVHIGWRIDVL
jgi:hypothetical protein